MNIDVLIDEICEGLHDDRLIEIMTAIEIRSGKRGSRKQEGAIKYLTFQVGDCVQFNTRVSPKYLAGVKGKITGKKQKNVVFTPDPGQYLGRFTSATITCPPSLLEKI